MKLAPLLGLLATAFPLIAQTPNNKPVDTTKDKNLYVVGYSHLDTQWRWTYPQVIREYIANTMRENFPLFEKYPNYVFNFTGSRRYEFMKEYYPEDYAKVKAYVAAGRWYPAGSSVDENDAIVPSLESYQRHFLYGNKFFDREFGRHSDEFMLPDCFGFPASLPSILHHGGVKGFSTQKLTWGSAVGVPFNVGVWEGPDGSEVVAALNPLSYNGEVREDLSQSEEWIKRINATGQKSGAYVDYHYYGVGDRGGAPGESSVNWVEKSIQGKGPLRVISSRADQLFNDLKPAQIAKLPRFKGEMLLTKHSSGAINSQAYMKRWNRKNELLANAAESAAVGAFWLGAFPYPQESLYRAWDLVLGSQMHDILPGTSIPPAYEFSWNDEVLALNQFASIATRSSAAILSALDTNAQGTPVAVYNPLSITREDPVEVLLPFVGQFPEVITAFGPDGKPVPTQILGREGDSLRVLFVAKAPPVGYAIYDLRPGVDESPKTGLVVSEKSLENERYRVTVNDSGDVASVFDKTANRELLSEPERISFHTERPREYPAWNMDWEDREKPARGYVTGPATFKIVENGPARVALEITRVTEGSTFVSQLRLSAGDAGNRVETKRRIDWQSLGASLKADYRFTVSNPNATYDSQVGVVVRDNNNPTRYEAPVHQWMDLTNVAGDYGVAVLNDSKYGSDKPADNSLRSTLLYTPGVRDSFQDQATQDIGRHEILDALYGHTGDWITGQVPWQAARLNQPLLAFLPTQHGGPLGKSFSLVTLNNPQAKIVALKKAEDSDEFIIRVQELTGKSAEGLQLAFPSAITSAREVNGQERDLGKLPVSEGKLDFTLKAFGVRAFAVQLAPAPQSVPKITGKPVELAYDIDVISPDSARADGSLNEQGETYPAEMLPASLVSKGVPFQMGSTANGAKNAVVARGQSITLPAGKFNRVHLLAAARNRDFVGSLKIGEKGAPLSIPNWTGFIGQWDNRLWDAPFPEAGYEGTQKTVGLVPGYIKPSSVAWFATHHHTPKSNTYYKFSYLFEADYDLPEGTTQMTLPDDENFLVFAVTVASEPAAAPAAAPLYDTLSDHRPGGAPAIPLAGQSLDNATLVSFAAPLYHQHGDLRYTRDGTDPTTSSEVYQEPFYLTKTTTLAVAQVLVDGTLGTVAKGIVTVNDTTPPVIQDVRVGPKSNQIVVEFSEPVDPAKTMVDSYKITPTLKVASTEVSPDGRVVVLSLNEPFVRDTKYVFESIGITDVAGNKLVTSRFDLDPLGVVYSRTAATLPDEKFTTKVENLPLKSNEPWTINVLVKPSALPGDLTLIAGFGQPTNNSAGGTSRYIAYFKDGIRFWASQADVITNSPLEKDRWQMLTATYDGQTVTVYKDGEMIGQKETRLRDDPDNSVGLGLPDAWTQSNLFQGRAQSFSIRRGALSSEEVKKLASETKPF